MKTKLEVSIKYLQPIYTLATFIGLVGIGFFVQTQSQLEDLDMFTVTSTVMYVIIQMFSILLMYLVNEKKEVLKHLIQSPRFTFTFLMSIRKYNKDIYRVLHNDIPKNEVLKNYCEHTQSSVNWLMLNTIITEEWETFRLFGFTFDDAQLIQKCVSISAFILAMNKYVVNPL
jgi:hypothetical protein